MRGLLALLLAVGLNTSLCTGGLFAVSSSIAQQVTYASQALPGPMSYGSIGILSCKRSDAEVSSHVGSVKQGHCNDADTCLVQVQSRIREKIVFAFGIVEELPKFLESACKQCDLPAIILSHSRDGPLFSDAPLLAQTLVKLE